MMKGRAVPFLSSFPCFALRSSCVVSSTVHHHHHHHLQCRNLSTNNSAIIFNHKSIFDSLASSFQVVHLDDWYKVSKQELIRESNSLNVNLPHILKKYYDNSLSKALKAIYPHHDWLPWKFQQVSKGFWDDINNHRLFFSWISQELKIDKLDYWYNVDNETLKHFHSFGNLISTYYKNSLVNALLTIYPNYDWKIWKFKKVPANYWESLDNQRKFFDWLFNELSMRSLDAWYDVSVQIVKANGGSSLLNEYYGNSLSKALQCVYAHHNWIPWKFKQVPKGFWNSHINVRKFLDFIAEQFGIQTLSDWEYLSTSDVIKFIPGSSHLFQTHGSLRDLLRKHFDIQQADTDKGPTSKTQIYLFRMLKNIFGSTKIFLNYSFNKEKIVFPSSHAPIQVDIYLPDFHLAFEYQGEQHYNWNYLTGDNFPLLQRDLQKIELCKKHGIDIFHVPFWWNRSKHSLIATLLQEFPHMEQALRPHIQSNHHLWHPFPKTQPVNRRKFPHDASYDNHVFYIRLGRMRGRPRCRQCKRILKVIDPRMEVKGTFIASDGIPYPTKFSFCIPDCFSKAFEFPNTDKKYGMRLPLYSRSNTKVGISKELMQTLQQSNKLPPGALLDVK